MTITEMRALVDLPPEASDVAVVAAFAALIEEGSAWPAGAVEPVTPQMLRDQCGIEEEISDELIEQKIAAAREWAEGYSGRIVVRRQFAASFRGWGRHLEILKRPVVSVDTIAYDGAQEAGIYANHIGQPGYPYRIFAGSGGWPSLRTGGGVTVIYTAGHAPERAPQRVIEAIQVLAAGMIGEREGRYDASLAAAKALLRQLRIVSV